MQKTCRQCSGMFQITEDDLAFYEKVSPVFGGKKAPIPPPTLCPDCRMQRRLAFRNEGRLHRRKCDLTGKEIFSMYPQESPFKIYDKNEWFGDRWDALRYGRPFDFSRPFFLQFAALMREVPRMSLVQQGTMENADFCNRASNDKNCYLLTSSNFDEDCYYSSFINDCRNSVDCFNVHRCELCYESHDSYDCYGSGWLEECSNCSESFFLKQCVGCKDCLFCTSLHQKQYCLFNEQRTAEEYQRLRKEMFTPTHRNRYEALKSAMIVKHFFGTQNEASTGNYLDHCRNARSCFEGRELEDCAYCQCALYAKDARDFSHWGRGVELVYETHGCGYNCQRVLFINESWDNDSDLLYCDQCMNSRNLFGCCGLRYKEYCILNKQYTKEEYERIVPQIIAKMKELGEWGEFFPVELSPFAYNETVAQEYFPLSKEEALRRSWKWREEKDEMPKVTKIIPASQLPDSIDAIPDDILHWAIQCEETKRPFKIIKQELEFYRKMKLPVPHFHPDERHRRRMALRNPRKLWKRTCAKCNKEIQTTYAPQRPEIVYCEDCYLKEVY